MSDPQTPFTVRAKAPYAARNDTEVTLVVGNTYTVLQTDGKGLWWQTKGPSGNIGWFPASYTDIVESSPVQAAPSPPPPQPVQQQPVQQQPTLQSTPGMSVKTTSLQTTTSTSNGSEEVPPPSKPVRLEDNPSTAYVLIQIVEGREMKKIDGNPSRTNPVAYIFRRDVMDFEGQGDCIFKTASCKKTVTPKWNEKFQINVYDAESEVLIIRFASNSKGSLSALKKSKTFMGEISFPLRSAARNFDRPNPQFKWYQLSEPTGGGAGTLGEVKIFIEFIDTKQVSVPSDFKQVSHIGWSADGGFDINNIPPEWKKIFKTVGISKKRLQENPELADKVLGIMNEQEQNNVQQASHVQVATNAPPPPPTPGQQQARVTPTAPTPPPAPVMGGGNIAPPPPPPPGMNAPVGQSGGLSGIANVQLHSTPQPAPSSPSTGRGSLLDQIRAGTSLTKVSDSPSPSGPSQSNTGNSLLDTLASALASNRNAIQGDDDDDWSDADDWSDSD